MKKQTKVLLAAAMMTMGATFSAMAASKGTWVLNEEGWQYADKDGEYVDNEWCKSNGIEFWVNDDEVLGSSEWVQDEEVENRWYYAQSDGSKTINAWKYLYAMDDEDEEGDQYWYYFDAKGRMVTGKKTIGDYTYHFNADGQMLTGWVEELKDEEGKVVGYTDANERTDVEGATIYTNEDGAVVKSSWINVFPWDETDGYEGDDEVWYYTTSAGKVTKGKKTIGDLTYIFDANGQMLTEWVGLGYAEGATFEAIEAADSADYKEVYYLDADYGYVKKNGWRYLESADGDDDFWFHFDKLGRAFMATSANASITAVEYTFNDGENIAKQFTSEDAITVNSKKIDGVVYYFNAQGEMIDGLQMIDNELVYLEDGARYTGKVKLTDENENDYTFYFGEKNDGIMDKYVAVNGAYKNYVYVNGQLITSDDSDSYRLVNVNGFDYVVDNNGKIQHKDGKDYDLGLGELTFHEDDDYILWPTTEDAE